MICPSVTSYSELSIIINPAEGSRPDCYRAGSNLSGIVRVETTKKTDDFGLQIIFTGKESVKVDYHTSGGSSQNSYASMQHSYSKRDIIRHTIPLVEAKTSLDAGQFIYPFEMQLSNDIPSSMYHIHKCGQCYCEIIYKIKAQMTGTRRHATEKIIIPVLAKHEHSSSSVPHLFSTVTAPIRMCGCVPKGEIAFAAKVFGHRVCKGDNVTISFACMNKSSARVKCASAKLIRTIQWVSDGHSLFSKKVITKRYFPLDEGMDRCSKVRMKRIKTSNSFETLAEKESLYNELLATVTAGKNQLQLSIPNKAMASYYGDLIKVTYVLVIKIKTSIFFTDPHKEIEMLIVEKNL